MKKCFLVTLTIAYCFLFNSVHAVVISSFGESAGGEESIACTSKVCARTEGIYDFLKPTESINGIRVSIVEADGKIYKEPINIWTSEEKTKKVKSYYSDNDASTNSYTIIEEKNFDGTLLFTGINTNGTQLYKNFFIYFDETKMNILLGFFGVNDNQEIRDKYFKIEPIFVVHEKHYDYTYYDAGTASEIMNGLSSRTDFKKSTGPYFVRGGNNIGVTGDWNVIRNYIVSIYFTCESRKSSGLSDNVACYDSIKMGDIAEKKEKKGENTIYSNCYDDNDATDCKNKGWPYLNKIYPGNGLGVGYIKISDYVDDVVSCLSGRVSGTEIVDENATTGHCEVTFQLDRQMDFNNISVVSGGIIKHSQDIITKGTLTKKCNVKGQYLKYSDYVDNMCLMNKNSEDCVSKLEIMNDVSEPKALEYNSESGKYEARITAEYRFPMIYAELITGKTYSQACPNCSFLGYGLISKFKDKGLIELDFGFDFNGKKYKTDQESFCSYNANQKLITTNENDYKLNLFFRTIDVKNSFPGKTNEFRTVGSNWCDDENCSGSSDENSTIKTVIADRNNSFNQTGDGPKYKITLTPSTILEIREYNKNKNYEDFNFTCKDDGSFCISNYLTELRGNYGLTIHSGSKKRLCVEEDKCE